MFYNVKKMSALCVSAMTTLLVTLLAVNISHAQSVNYINNGSFEDTVRCPAYTGANTATLLNYSEVVGWINNIGTPNIMNLPNEQCPQEINRGASGWSTGSRMFTEADGTNGSDGYKSITWNPWGGPYEAVGTKLNQPLKEGQTYRLTFDATAAGITHGHSQPFLPVSLVIQGWSLGNTLDTMLVVYAPNWNYIAPNNLPTVMGKSEKITNRIDYTAGSNNWKNYTIEFEAPFDAEYVSFDFTSDIEERSVWWVYIDNMALVDGDPVDPLSPVDANDDAAAVDAAGNNASVDIDVLANDSVPEGFSALAIVDVPMQGSAQVFTPAGSSTPQIRYTLADGFSGSGVDSLIYQVTDAEGQTGTASVTVQINEVIDALALANDVASVSNDFPIREIDVLDNDSIPEGVASLQIIVAPVQGDASVFTPAGSSMPQIRYELASAFVGEDTLVYQVTDAKGQTGTASVTIQANTVVPPSLQLADDAASTDNSVATVNINVLANDSVPEGVALLEIVSAPAQGAAAVFTPAGSSMPQIRYTLPSGFVGEEVLVYRVTDNDDQTGTASVTIDVSEQEEEQTCAENFLQLKCVLCFVPFLQEALGCPMPPATVNIDITGLTLADGAVVIITGTVTEGAQVSAVPVGENGQPTGSAPLTCAVTGMSFSCEGIFGALDSAVTATADKDGLTDQDEEVITCFPNCLGDQSSPSLTVNKFVLKAGVLTIAGRVQSDAAEMLSAIPLDGDIEGSPLTCVTPGDEQPDELGEVGYVCTGAVTIEQEFLLLAATGANGLVSSATLPIR